jgi:hypothetical protein
MAWRTTNGWGTRLLAIWLIVTGALPLLGMHIPGAGQLLSGLAIAAGILILIGK